MVGSSLYLLARSLLALAGSTAAVDAGARAPPTPPAGWQRTAILPTGREPKQVALSPDGRFAWVAALDGPPSVWVHDLQEGTVVAQLTLGTHGAVEVLFSRDGRRVYASQMETGLVYELDAEKHRLLRTLNAHGKWSKVLALSADGSHLFVSNWLGHDISELDLASGELVRKLPAVQTPRGLYATADGRSLFVAGFEHGELGKVDLVSHRLEVVWSGGGALRHIVGDPVRGLLYISDMARARIWSFDLRSHRVRALARTDRNPNTIALSPDGRTLFVSCRGRNGPGGYLTVAKEGGTVAVIDTTTGARVATLPAGHQPTALTVSADGRRLVFSDFRDDQLEVYDIPAELRGAASAAAGVTAASGADAGTPRSAYPR